MNLEKKFNKIKLFIYNLYIGFNKLDFIKKLFIVFLLLLLWCILFNNMPTKIENFENDEIGLNKENYSKNFDNDVYDNFFSNKYDQIYLNPNRNNFEIKKIKQLVNKSDKILDIGCGTGYNINTLTKEGYDITGIDQSKYMIKVANERYNEGKFLNENILNIKSFDYNSFNMITCLGRTLYEIKDKETFFENCYGLLEDNGILLINIVDRENFKPYCQDTNSNDVLFNPEKYNKNIDNIIVKFKDGLEFKSQYNKLYNNSDDSKYNLTNNNAIPYRVYFDEFNSYSKNNPIKKQYEINLYIPTIKDIRKLAESKGFTFDKNINMKEIGSINEYLYIFRK